MPASSTLRFSPSPDILQGPLFDLVPSPLAVLDQAGVILAANPSLSEMLGVSVEGLIGQALCDLFSTTAGPGGKPSLPATAADLCHSEPANLWRARGDGQRALSRWELRAIPGSSHLLASGHRIAAQDPDEELRKKTETCFRCAFDDAPLGTLLVDVHGNLLHVNRAFAGLLGRSAEELAGLTFNDITYPEDRDLGLGALRQMLQGDIPGCCIDKRYLGPKGEVIWARVNVSLVRDARGAPSHFVTQVENLTDMKRAEERLRFLAHHDGLTGLLNRRSFDRELELRWAHATSTGRQGALLLLDVDNFKDVNDSYGHPVGDAYLRGLGEALTDRLRKTDVVARLGGDEFGVILTNVEVADALRIAHSIGTCVAGFVLDAEGEKVRATISVGVAPLILSEGGSPCSVMSMADRSLYAAKWAGRNTVTLAEGGPRPV